MEIAIPLFDRVTALDAIGPYEVLSRVPGAEVVFVAAQPGAKRTDTGALALTAERGLDDVPQPEIVVVPGGRGTRDQPHDELVAWIQHAHQTSRYTTSVCTGALLLGAAGILEGLRATTHWLFFDQLRALGAEPTLERVVEQGKGCGRIAAPPCPGCAGRARSRRSSRLHSPRSPSSSHSTRACVVTTDLG